MKQAHLADQLVAVATQNGFTHVQPRMALPEAALERFAKSNYMLRKKFAYSNPSGQKYYTVTDLRYALAYYFSKLDIVSFPVRTVSTFQLPKGSLRLSLDITGVKGDIALLEVYSLVQHFLASHNVQSSLQVSHTKAVRGIMESLQVQQPDSVMQKLRKYPKKEKQTVIDAMAPFTQNAEQVFSAIYEKEHEPIEEINHFLDLCAQAQHNHTVLPRSPYYEGIVFALEGNENHIGYGGQHSKLHGLLLHNVAEVPSVSITIDMTNLALLVGKQEQTPKVFVAPFGNQHAKYAIEVLQELRKNNISAICDIGNKNISKSLQFAKKSNIPYVVIVGKQEQEQQVVQLKSMQDNTQTKCTIPGMIQALQ